MGLFVKLDSSRPNWSTEDKRPIQPIPATASTGFDLDPSGLVCRHRGNNSGYRDSICRNQKVTSCIFRRARKTPYVPNQKVDQTANGSPAVTPRLGCANLIEKLLHTTVSLFMPTSFSDTLIDKNVSNVPFSEEEQPAAGAVWYVTGMSATSPLTCHRKSRREYLSRRCKRLIQASERVPVDAPLPSFFPPRIVSERLEIHQWPSPFDEVDKRSSERAHARRRTRVVAASSPASTAGWGLTYSAGNRFVPFLVQLISPRLVRFHKAVRRPPLSSGTVGNCTVNACSTSGAVNRSSGRDLMIVRTVSVRLPEPVTCAVKALMEPLIACNKSLFFWARFDSSSISRSSASIRATRSAWMSISLGWRVGALIDLHLLPWTLAACKGET
jgi:hypothetical protein